MLNRTNLHNYQNACVEHIINNPYCGVFLDMGLGKTVSTLTAVELLMNDYCEINKVLVIAPKRVAESVWQEEAEKWGHLKHLRFSKIIGSAKQREAALKEKADIYIISRDNVAWLCALYGGGKLPFDMVVIDELSSFKSYKSERFKALRGSRPYFKRLVGLTGTPAPNGLIDLWPQIYLMDRGERLEKTITRYREKYFKPGQTNGNVVYSYKLLTDSEKLIHKKIEDICISMKADDYLRMPVRTDNYIKLRMPKELKSKYDEFEKNKVLELIQPEQEYLEAIDKWVDKPIEINVVNAAALSNKLLQFANGAIYTEAPDLVSRDVVQVHDIKLEALSEIIENSNGQSVLVAWTFRFDRDRIMEYLKKYKPRELKNNKDIEDWNNGKIQVMLAHPASAGHGLNLQAGGSIIVWFGQTWSLELYQQFNARLYRQGQQSHVVINHLILEGTHDEEVIKALKMKDKKQNALMDSIKAKIDKYKKFISYVK